MMGVIETSWFQTVSAAVVTLAGATLLWIATEPNRFDRYGREALFCAGLFMISVGWVRILIDYGVLTVPQARAWNTCTAALTLLIIAQAMFLGHRHKRLQ